MKLTVCLALVVVLSVAGWALSRAGAEQGCPLLYIGFDDSLVYCICDPEDNLCHGGGFRIYLYDCQADFQCRQPGTTCVRDPFAPKVLVRITATPTCEDVGWWPWGPECNEQSDCQITAWTDNWGWVDSCCCLYEAK